MQFFEPDGDKKSNLSGRFAIGGGHKAEGWNDRSIKKWNSEYDKFHSLVQTFAGLLESNILNLKALKIELAGKCKHPKKMRDKLSDGQWYCMNCNLDL